MILNGEQAQPAINKWASDGSLIDDDVAQTIASWYMSSSPLDANLTALAHGREFNLDALCAEVQRDLESFSHPPDLRALLAWVRAAQAA